MTNSSTPTQLTGFMLTLVNDGHFSEEALRECLAQAQKIDIDFVRYLLDYKSFSPKTLAQSFSKSFNLPLFDLFSFRFEELPHDALDAELVASHHILPLIKDNQRFVIAISNPEYIETLEKLLYQNDAEAKKFRKMEGVVSIQSDAYIKPTWVVVEYNKLEYLVQQNQQNQQNKEDEEDYLTDEERETRQEKQLKGDELQFDAEPFRNKDNPNELPIIKYVNALLFNAIRLKASDLHFEPYEKSYRVRYRIDGILRQVATPSVDEANRLSSRLKVMSQMDISEKRMPQDGRIKLKVAEDKAIDFRVNSLPTLFGEKIVLRILDPSSAMLGIDVLGYEPDQKKLFLDALHQPQGMVLITGPTGSGKTVSLYTGLNILNTESANISTAEDPVEINLEGINQVNVNPKVGLNFATALRSFLRQDPDIIMVGEIRDIETAEIAIKAAQTGHMVLSTLHTNSAPETLTRLRNMGVPSFNIATSVNLVIAQRLVRKLCSRCKRPINIPNKSLLELGFTNEDLTQKSVTIFEAVGCSECREGYKGRVGVYEVMKITPEIAQLIMEDANSIQIAKKAQELGFNNLRRSGLNKVMQGLTTLQEVNRVTND
ncbi:type IV-A pilus assembly ATPase PilB [Acinetobacter sp. B10A]|uniref:type IV-A pilus assembly ATPase PilB n=1 Tax=Acinetobacter baretiae TaxID=2605383 RepID=UPI001B3C7964|nr:type IV-A pilus assembly ATPase PilB [Acinetobacter baretiae]MBF7686296.1 type IV-A pilus assembly ATPase PilB [Acinetobacter baretiae]